MDSSTWQPGFGGDLPPFGAQIDGGRGQEDWEDWLRWDPAAEPASPDFEISNSGSSKNDSPVQGTVWPVTDQGMAIKDSNDTIAPPMIVGDDGMTFSTDAALGSEPFMFGTSHETATNFNFDNDPGFHNNLSTFPKLDTHGAPWILPSNAGPDDNTSLSAVSKENGFRLPMAGPATATTPSLGHSPQSSSHRRSSGSPHSPPAQVQKKRAGRKRKAELEPEPEPDSQDDNDGSLDENGDGPPMKKTSHNVIEKRYRNNLTDKIDELKNSVPTLRAMLRANRGDESEDLEGLTPAHKHNKATIMAKATEYIKHLEKRNQKMADDMAQLKARLSAVEAAVGNNRDRQSSLSASPTIARARQPSSSSQSGSPSFLNVPSEQSGHPRTPSAQQQYMQAQAQPIYARPPNPPVDAQNNMQYRGSTGGGLVNRIMLGGMAGLMAMEGLSEQQGDSGSYSGLVAFPTQLFRRGDVPPTSSIAALSRQAMVPLLKIVMVVGTVLYLMAPLLTFKPRKAQKAQRPSVRLSQVPSLASPVEVRRQAWLTAVQSVWVPKHFLLEVVAVAIKMIKLSVRRLIGTETFNYVTGTGQDDEVARIKAWDIAIDAQLAGGDVEVSYYRLLLTLMASGTLPDSPTRLMQKAVHFRVFFWDVANAGYGNMMMFKQFTEKVGRIYWESARRLQKELEHAKSQGRPYEDNDTEVLPPHLARLVELDSDEVLSDEMIQRAWNLAWNKPSAYNTLANQARDSVVEDHAIRSPLDAVAAWYANIVVDDTLADALHADTSCLDMEYYLGLAVSIAPPSSGTLARSLAAKAILSTRNREKNIIAALEALPVSSPTAGMSMVAHTPVSPDIRTSLTLAKLLALLPPSHSSATRSNALDMLASLHLPPSSFTLLTAIAAYKLLLVISNEKQLTRNARYGAEDLASSLRVWAGTAAGRVAGLEREERGTLISSCLSVTKKLGGWCEKDSGYGSVEASPVRLNAELAAAK